MKRHTQHSSDSLLTIPEAAERARVRPRWYYTHISNGTLPFPYLKVGRYVRIRERDLEEYLDRQTRPAGTAA